jgi:hypothetical protein
VTRTVVMGDPQAPHAQVRDVLAHHGVLASGRVAPAVTLVSAGDHFDYDLDDTAGAGREGLVNLRWLASHDRDRVRILFGNHDAARVMELISLDDERFAAARALARHIRAVADREGWSVAERLYDDEFVPRFPDLPTPGLAARDYASYSVEQRALVIELLLAGRFDLAIAGELRDGRRVLLTHAGVTTRELAMLGLADERDPAVIAAALQARFRAAIEERRADWTRGVLHPLSLEPLHVSGRDGAEGGGLLYHRPAQLDRPGANRAWEADAARPRRFDPRTLPSGLLQVVGHTGHHKARTELGDRWVSAAAREQLRGGIRTLRVTGDDVRYELGALPAEPGSTDLYLVDGEMWRVPAAEYRLFELARLLS